MNANKWTSLAEGKAEAKTAAALRHVSSDSRDGGREGGGGGGDSGGGGYRELKIEWKETLLRGSREKSSFFSLSLFPSRSCYDDTMSSGGGGPDESSVRVALR